MLRWVMQFQAGRFSSSNPGATLERRSLLLFAPIADHVVCTSVAEADSIVG